MKTGSTNQVSATNTNTASLYSAPSQSYQNKGCWPGYHPSQSAEWWVWEMGCCSNPEKTEIKEKRLSATHYWHDTSYKVRSRECWRTAVYPAINELARASTNSVLFLHTVPCLAMGIVRQGLQKICPPGKRFKSINTNNLDKF